MGIIVKRYMKGAPFLATMVYKRVRGWTSERSLSVNYVDWAPPGLSWVAIKYATVSSQSLKLRYSIR